MLTKPTTALLLNPKSHRLQQTETTTDPSSNAKAEKKTCSPKIARSSLRLLDFHAQVLMLLFILTFKSNTGFLCEFRPGHHQNPIGMAGISSHGKNIWYFLKPLICLEFSLQSVSIKKNSSQLMIKVRNFIHHQ